MKILVVTPYIPYPPSVGGSVRMYHLIRQLARRHEIHLVTFCEAGGLGDPAGLAPYCRTIATVPRYVGNKRRRQMRSLFQSRSYQLSSHTYPEMQTAIDQAAAAHGIEAVLVEFSQMGGYRFPEGLPLVVDEHNVEYDLLARMAERGGWSLRKIFNLAEARKFRREELALLRRATLTLTTSDRDRDVLRQAVSGLPVAVITNGVDTDWFAPPPDPPPRRPRRVVFVGATHYFPNEDGVLFYMREIHARVRAALPDVETAIVGGLPAPAVRALASDKVLVTGVVPDVRPYLWEASAFIVPLRMGGGTRFKVVEAMAAGVPVVSTRLGAEGIPVTHEREALLADEPAAFAEAVVRLLTDAPLARRLAAAGLEFVKASFDWRVIGDRIEEAWHELER